MAANQIILATRNAHKVSEIRAMLPAEFQCRSLAEFLSAPSVVEDANSFAGNATKKAVELACWLANNPGLLAASAGGRGREEGEAFVLADDSGLEVDALHGAPGVDSARFAAAELGLTGNSPDSANNEKLLRLLKDVPPEKRTARFRCVLALAPIWARSPEGRSPVCSMNEVELGVRLFDGICEGRIGLAPRGVGGFGYDPLFLPTGYDLSFAELGESIKNEISHRADALRKCKEWFAAK